MFNSNPFLADFFRTQQRLKAEQSSGPPVKQSKPGKTALVSLPESDELSVESIIQTKPKPAVVLQYLRNVISEFEKTH